MTKRNILKEEMETINKKTNGKHETLEDEKDSNLKAVQSETEEDSIKENIDLDSLSSEYQEELCNKEKELQELNDMYLRLKADFSNYKRRVDKEKESIYSYAAESLVTQMLEILDNFERAMSCVTKEEKDSSLYQGVEMIYNQFFDALKKSGLEEIKSLNEKFDPNFHHGVAQEQSDEHEEDIVLEVFQKGYKLKEKVIRPSMVKICKK